MKFFAHSGEIEVRVLPGFWAVGNIVLRSGGLRGGVIDQMSNIYGSVRF